MPRMQIVTKRRYGALPSQSLRSMIRAGMLPGAREENISPASLDLSLSGEAYRVRGTLQTLHGELVTDVLKAVSVERHDLSLPLLRGHTYMVRLNESTRLPDGIYGYTNPKSSTGRPDLHVRVLVDGIPRYDTVPDGYHGPLWISISPKSFSVLVTEGETLTQLRLFTGDTRLSELELKMAIEEYRLVWKGSENIPMVYKELAARDDDGSLVLTLDLKSKCLGWVAKNTEAVLALSKIGHYSPTDFFEPLLLDGQFCVLKKDHFYILSTDERIRVPPVMATEMVPMDERAGDFRSHYAGFIDPGWGWGHMGEGFGRPFTLEVRPFEDIVARHGQPIAKLRFEYITEAPDITYDTKPSNYLEQAGPRLGKQFWVPNS